MSVQPQQPHYRQVADLIRTDITAGVYPAGSTLPSEDNLAERYRVSRRTVNRAETILRADGLISVSRGRGTTVRALPVLTRNAALRFAIRDAASARGAFQAELERLGLTARAEVEISETLVPHDLVVTFGLADPPNVIERARRMFCNDQPVQLATSWIPSVIAAGTVLVQADTGPGGTYSRLADLGHAIAHFTETVSIRQPSETETEFLRLDAEQRVFLIRRVAREGTGRAVEVTDSVLAAHQWQLVYDWDAGL